jgi:hypothetical protein
VSFFFFGTIVVVYCSEQINQDKMTYEIKIITEGRNYSGCYSFKGYRKDLKKCITAANNEIDRELLERKHKKDVKEVWVRITSFGRKVYGWKYIPTIR